VTEQIDCSVAGHQGNWRRLANDGHSRRPARIGLNLSDDEQPRDLVQEAFSLAIIVDEVEHHVDVPLELLHHPAPFSSASVKRVF
jgi:hypothetical protein